MTVHLNPNFEFDNFKYEMEKLIHSSDFWITYLEKQDTDLTYLEEGMNEEMISNLYKIMNEQKSKEMQSVQTDEDKSIEFLQRLLKD